MRFKQLIKAQNVQVFSSNYTLYGDMSQRVMESLKEFTPELEMYSIDEAFLNLTGFEYLDLTEYGRKIKKSIKQWTGIPVSVGYRSNERRWRSSPIVSPKRIRRSRELPIILDPKDEHRCIFRKSRLKMSGESVRALLRSCFRVQRDSHHP